MLARRALAELVGTAFLLMAVVGSGIMAETLSPRPDTSQPNWSARSWG